MLLTDWSKGDPQALERLVDAIYPELRRIASAKMAGERRAHTLQPSALVNEAFLRVRELHQIDWQSRGHFLAVAATFMRRILVEHARAKKGAKRGGGALQVSLTDLTKFVPGPQVEVLDVDRALQKLHDVYPRKARVVELRCFGGLEMKEIASVVGASTPTVERDWRFACAWLKRELG